MKKQAFIFIFSLFSVYLELFGQTEVKQLTPEFLATISSGSGAGELGYRASRGGGEGDTAPTTPAFFADEIYIFDCLNWRITVYDLDMHFLRNIDIVKGKPEEIIQTSKLHIFYNGDFSVVRMKLYRFGSDGRIIYELPYERFPMNFSLQSKYWLYQGYVIFYQKNGEIGVIDDKGNLLDLDDILKLQQDFFRTNSFGNNSDSLSGQIRKYLQENRLLLIDNRLQSAKPQDFFGYYRVIRGVVNDKSRLSILDEKLKESSGYLYGFDDANNSYWQFTVHKGNEDIIIVYVVSEDGYIITKFRIDGKGFPVIAPNGDVYLVEKKVEQEKKLIVFNYYRVKRQW